MNVQTLVTKLLLVDDEENSRLAVKEYLESRGYDVCAVADGEEAVAAGLELAPGVLICDWLLPGERSGLEVVKRLLATFPDLVVLVVTGLPASEVAHEVGELPISGIYSKPLSLSVIEHAVRDALRT